MVGFDRGGGMHLVQAKGILNRSGGHLGMNVYRGCTHGCIYCDSRSACYHMNHAFEDVEAKQNAPELLARALGSMRTPRMVGSGSMADPYQPSERELRLMRRCLEVIERYGVGATLITKSDAVLDDLDLLDEINRHAKCVVQVTLTTYDDGLARVVEPHVAPTSRRLAVLEELRRRGIPTVVWLSPILPYINDTEANVRSILDACASVGVKGIVCFGMGLTLREGNREHYYAALERHFPGLKETYVSRYGTAYQVLSPANGSLMRLFEDTCRAHGILSTPDECFAYLNDLPPRQLSLF